MPCRTFLMSLLLLMLAIVGFSGCKEKPIEPISRDQIVAQKVYDDCKESSSKDCLADAVTARAEQYCSYLKLSRYDCLSVKYDALETLRNEMLVK